MKKQNREQILWLALLFVALMLFVTGIKSGNLWFNFGAIILGIIIYKCGYSILFSEFDKKMKNKREEAERFRELLLNREKDK